ncbi:uncharacterized protein LOC112348795 [Selaginella moellendorffii]|uniref:uncharacterized protein LOC112348795 n=1 Tax=Selaginella moellendorffii TaxID=88036 RepID=UPI000D1C97F0|nr:uncharacterized protein LOC112348795 [Selaginella moellendorffii]|eukprot:XP_024537772.1 uncharacterized protein LOC112348795 [Selaginella moellendorffii]
MGRRCSRIFSQFLWSGLSGSDPAPARKKNKEKLRSKSEEEGAIATRKRKLVIKRWCRRSQHEMIKSCQEEIFREERSIQGGQRAPANSEEDEDREELLGRRNRCSLHSSQYSSSPSSSSTFRCFESSDRSPASSSWSKNLNILEASIKPWDCDVARRRRRSRSRRRRGSGDYVQCSVIPVLSSNPYRDFKESVSQMITGQRQIDLVELLECYLALNSPGSHRTIFQAFSETFLSGWN